MADDSQTKSGMSDETKKTGTSDETKNTEKKYDSDSIQQGINIATAKHKKEIETIQRELAELRKFREEKELEKAEAEQKDLEKKQEYQKIIEKNKTQFIEKETKLTQTIGTLEKDIRRLVIDSEIAKLAPELKVIPEAISDFISITAPLMGYAKEEKDGQISYKVFPANNGNPILNRDGKEMAVKEFLAQYLEQKDYFKQSATQGGSGSKGGRSSGSTITDSRSAIHEGLQRLYKGK